MLEQPEKKFAKTEEGMDEKELFQKTVFGFIEAIPESGPLYEKTERGERTTRAIAFGEFYNQLSLISEGARNLNKEQRMAIVTRTEILKREAFYWTKQSDSGRNFAEEINEMAKSIWRR